MLKVGMAACARGPAQAHHQALDLTFDGTLIDEMSFQILAFEDPWSMVLTGKSAAIERLLPLEEVFARIAPPQYNRWHV
jgi:hypothetical protein